MKNGLLLAITATLLASCATVKNNYVPTTEQISLPPVGEVSFARLGEEMLQQGTATTTEGVYLPQQNQIGGINLSAGFYPKTGEDDKFIFAREEARSGLSDMGRITVGALMLPPQGIRFDKRKQETCAIVPNMYGMSQPACDTEYSYQVTERPLLSPNNFQQTLIYSGRVGDRIRISYREFSGSVARAPFTNEAEYDLSASDTIAYRGAKIRVIDANNESIRYEVLSNFNSEK